MGKQTHKGEGWRRIAERTAGLLALASLTNEIVDVVRAHGFPDLRHWAGWSSVRLIVLALLIAVWAFARFPRLRFWALRIFMGPAKLPPEVPLLFRGPQPYRTGDRLPGRQADGDACWLGLEQDRFFILEGESGCGKSSLLNAFLFPRAQKEFQTIRVRVTDDPFRNVLQALRELVGAAAPDWPADSSGLRQAIQAVAPSKGGANGARPVLLCIDQFEEIFGAVNDRVRSSFMEELRNAVHCFLLRLLVVVRIDYSDLLINLCREVDPDGGALDPGNYFVLKPFRKEQALRVVHEIFSPITAGNQQLERELDMFGEALVEDLLQPPRDNRLCREDERTVLPAELQMVGQAIESLGLSQFTAGSFRRLGGRNGLLNLYIEDAKISVTRRTGVPGERALLILRQLLPQAKTASSKTPAEISRALSLGVRQVSSVLEAFGTLKLVNKLPTLGPPSPGEEPSAPRYELMHEHLAQIIQESHDRTLQRAREADERLRFWRDRMASFDRSLRHKGLVARLRSLLSQIIPVTEILSLWRFARAPEDRRMLWRSLRAVFLKAALVVAPIILVVAFLRTDFYLIHQIVTQDLTVDPVQSYFDIDGFADILAKSGYPKQARTDIDNALASISAKSPSANQESDALATVVLNARKGVLLASAGDSAGANQSFQKAEDVFNQLGPYDNSRLWLGPLLGEYLAVAGSKDSAISHWKLAFDPSKGWPAPSYYDTQFIFEVRGISALNDPAARRELWKDVIEIVRQTYYAPANCRTLAIVAADLYKDGDPADAEALWADVLDTAKHFEPAPPPPPPPSSRNQRNAAPPVYSPPRRSKQGLMIEVGTYDSIPYDRLTVLVGVALQMYRMEQKKDDARRLWREAFLGAGELNPVPLPPAAGAPANAPAPNTLPAPPPGPSKLVFYDDLAESLYRRKEYSLESEVEQAILESAKQKVELPVVRAQVLAYSAGRVHAFDATRTAVLWNAALDAAHEIPDQPNTIPGRTTQFTALSTPPRILTSNPQLMQIQDALRATRDPDARSYVFAAVAWMLLRLGEIPAALQAFGAMSDDQRRQSNLADAVMGMIERGEISNAKLVTAELYKAALRVADDNARSAQLRYAAGWEARLGFFRTAKQFCEECNRFDKLAVDRSILTFYEARSHPLVRQAIAESENRSRVDWIY